jgi:alpha-tubulin suppressor-like RCC1 family protein
VKRLLLLALLSACGGHEPLAATPTTIATPRVQASETPVTRAPHGTKPRHDRIQIALGNAFACIRVRSTLHCWRRRDGVELPLSKQAPVTGLGDVVDVTAGYEHVCASNDKGHVFCWGSNRSGQLGAGVADLEKDQPIEVPGLGGVVGLSAGTNHTCALLADGGVSCWGDNHHGQTGSDVIHGPQAYELVQPERVAGIEHASSLAAGRDQTCARTPSGWSCWGRSYLASQRAAHGEQSNEPFAVPELAEADSVAFDNETACALFASGQLGCWGSGAFSLFPSRPLQAGQPVPVELQDARQIAVGDYHACAIVADRTVSCFGVNYGGQLGRGDVDSAFEPRAPAPVPGLARVVSLALDSTSSCAVTDADEVWCWGLGITSPSSTTNHSGSPQRIAL